MTESAQVRIGSFLLDDVANRLVGADGDRPISPLAARLLVMLADRRGEPVSRAAIIKELWADNHLVGENALNRLVSETRRALDDSPSRPRIIQTVPRVGYRLVDERNAPEAAPARPAPPLWQRVLLWGLLALFVAVLLNWLLEQAIGLAWVLRHGD
jgi:DNA-binding winged helix-turn-helix (wHTH) protein